MKCKHWDSSCHLGSPEKWEECQEYFSIQDGVNVECSELHFGWRHYPDSPFGNVDICTHGVCRTHETNDAVCKWCSVTAVSKRSEVEA